ncbi:MAG: TlpA disulfide reductase family protein [Motiliproteus sp.]
MAEQSSRFGFGVLAWSVGLFFALLLVISLLVNYFLSGVTDPRSAQSVVSAAKTGVGGSVSDLSLPRLDGVSVTLNQFEGKVLVLNFWATWCGPCREEMPALQSLSKQLDPQSYRVIGINVDQDQELVQQFIKEYQLDFLQLSDRTMRVSNDLLGIAAFPQTLIVDQTGKIDRVIVGNKPWDDPAYYQPLLAIDAAAATP